ncbi:hypothetical protein Phi19:2_gp008 [Cellulophaga phage phi19:2]|uniref:Uncharacterized protein n=2 Tax=Cellulophaga phage phiST TaxID=756282 RepID=M4SPW8_9CAUD|nr:hypothetical protein CGPG_00098 [Cellulophaga phage phiST]AGH56796.1 hypothetical protein CGPG_00098 [Cellulophaga phage phiST]AGO47147.1 hypothetical protein PhiST_gp008 [Cellulophaga phage phiST]AGO48643.1 hypothetical protein Phi19:2_gp008 [Cellulophaga phage phi19:2]
MTTQVTITKQDFDNSHYLNTKKCAVCCALNRIFPKSKIEVGGSSFWIDDYCYRFDSAKMISPTFDNPKTKLENVVLRFCNNKQISQDVVFTFQKRGNERQ